MNVATIEKIMKLSQQTEESLTDAFSLLLCAEDRKSVDPYVRWVRGEAKKIHSAAMYELIRQTYFYAAQYCFDDFMIAMEWNREPQARFWLPRRKVLEGKHHIATKIQNFMDDPDALFLGFSMPPGCGKTTLIKFLLAYIIGQFKPGGAMTNGFIQFAVMGGRESQGGLLAATRDENTVILRMGEQTVKGEEIRDYVEKRILELAKPQAAVVMQQTSAADEIIKFKNLLDMGVITQEEFDAKKKQLLGL